MLNFELRAINIRVRHLQSGIFSIREKKETNLERRFLFWRRPNTDCLPQGEVF